MEDKQSRTPLLTACEIGNEEAGKLLLDFTEIKMLWKDNSLITSPIYCACRTKKSMINLLQNMLDKIKQDSTNTLKDTLKDILAARDNNNRTLLDIAIQNNFDLTKLLIERYNANINVSSGPIHNYPIHLSAQKGSVELLDLLVGKHADLTVVNSDGNTALHIAALHNKPLFIEAFKRHERHKFSENRCCQKRNTSGLTPLMCAVFADNTKCVRALFKLSIFEELSGEAGTIFHLTAKQNSLTTFEYLFHECKTKLINTNINQILLVKDANANTLLHIACRYGHLDFVVKVLSIIENKDELVFAKNSEEQTCFHMACLHGNESIVSHLLNNFNQPRLLSDQDRQLNTPLHLACINNNESVVEILLGHKEVEVNATNLYNLTAFDICFRKGHLQLMTLVLDKFKSDDNDFSYLDPSFEKLDSVQQHPLHIIASSNEEHLIMHDSVKKLVDFKWPKLPRYLYYINLITYLIFVLLLTFHIVIAHNLVVNDKGGIRVSGTNSTAPSTTYFASNLAMMTLAFTILLLFMHVLKELFQIYHSFFIKRTVHYFYKVDNLLEISTYVLSFIFLIPWSNSFNKDLNQYK